MDHRVWNSRSAGDDDEFAMLVDRLTAGFLRGEGPDLAAVAGEFPGYERQLAEIAPTLTALAKWGLAATEVDASDALCGRELGDFRLIREVGRGGMGVVFEAEQLSLARRVAVKILPFAALLDSSRLERFKNEARAAAMLKHPNIVSVHYVGCERGVHFYAMEFVEGQSLAEVCALLRVGPAVPAGSEFRSSADSLAGEGGPEQFTAGTAGLTLPVAALSTERQADAKGFYKRIARLGIQAAEALHFAHQHGVIHRDIKPSNLLLDESGSLHITDFGLARVQSGEDLTATGDFLGTLRYMSPEQVDGHDVIDHRTDVYSLGLTLFELATGQSAIRGDNRAEIVRNITEASRVAPRTLDPQFPKDLETILLKAIATGRDDRYLNAAEFAEDLRRFVEHRPITARRVGLFAKTVRWAGRNRLAASLAGVALVLLLTLAVGGPIAAVQQRELAERMQELAQEAVAERDRAQTNLDLAQQLVNDVLSPAAHVVMFAPQTQELHARLVQQGLDFYRGVVAQDPKNLALRHGLANALIQFGQQRLHTGDDVAAPTLEAIMILRDLTEEYPDSLELHRSLSRAYNNVAYYYFVTSRNGEGLKMSAHAVEIAERLRTHRGWNATCESELAYFELTRAKLNDSVGLHQLAEAQYRSGLSRIRASSMRNAFAEHVGHQNLGDLLMRRGRFDEAAVELENARRIALAKLARDANVTQEVVTRFWLSWIHDRLALLRLQTGELDLAEEHAASAIAELSAFRTELPHVYWSDYMLGYFKFTQAELYILRGRLEDAARATREMADLWHRDRPEDRYNSGLAHWLHGEILHARGESEAAEKYFAIAADGLSEFAGSIPTEPHNNERLVVFLSNCASPRFRDPHSAVRIARRVLTESNGPMWRYLGLAQYRAGDFESAATSIRHSMQLRSGGDALDLYLLACILQQSGQIEQARETLKQAGEAESAGRPVLYGYVGTLGFQRLREEAERLVGGGIGVDLRGP